MDSKERNSSRDVELKLLDALWLAGERSEGCEGPNLRWTPNRDTPIADRWSKSSTETALDQCKPTISTVSHNSDVYYDAKTMEPSIDGDFVTAVTDPNAARMLRGRGGKSTGSDMRTRLLQLEDWQPLDPPSESEDDARTEVVPPGEHTVPYSDDTNMLGMPLQSTAALYDLDHEQQSSLDQPNPPSSCRQRKNRQRFYILEVNADCPLHGLLASDAPSRKIASAVEQVDFLQEQSYAAKEARKRHRRRIMHNAGREEIWLAKKSLCTRLCLLLAAWVLMSSGFYATQSLHSAVNGPLGLAALAVLHLSAAAALCFLPQYVQARLTWAQQLLFALVGYAAYMTCNVLRQPYSLLPAAALFGVAQCIAWTTLCDIIVAHGRHFALLNTESSRIVIVRLFGLFFTCIHVSQVIGNVVPSLIFHQPDLSKGERNEDADILDKVYQGCGKYFHPMATLQGAEAANLQSSSASEWTWMCGIFFICCLFSALIICLGYSKKHDSMAAHFRRRPPVQYDVWAVVKMTGAKGDFVKWCSLLVPLTLYHGMQQAFLFGFFDKAFVGCCLGIKQIGIVVCAFALADSVCSLFFGPIIKMFGRMPLFTFGLVPLSEPALGVPLVVNMLMVVTLMCWPPVGQDAAILYAVAISWGMADAAWSTQIADFWVVCSRYQYKEAFTVFCFWQWLGFAIQYIMITFLGGLPLLYTMGGVLATSMLAYAFFEYKFEQFSRIYQRGTAGRSPMETTVDYSTAQMQTQGDGVNDRLE